MKSLARLALKVINGLRRRLEWLLARPTIWSLRSAGRGIVARHGLRIDNPDCVSIGDGVDIAEHCWISTPKSDRELGKPERALEPRVTIGSGTYIGRFFFISCISRIEIGERVVIADNVFIGDNAHGHARRDLPILDQYMHSPGPVSIGAGAWIGTGACILANVRIGKNCVIGANAVVTKDVPDFHVAAGIPARALRTVDGAPSSRS